MGCEQGLTKNVHGITALRRRWTLSWFSALAAVIIHAASGGISDAAAAEQSEIHVAVAARAISAIPLLTAKAKGFFADEGLDVKFDYFGSGPAAVASLLGGSSQFLYGALVDNLKAVHRGQPLVVTMAGLSELTVALVIRKDIALKLGHPPTVKDLKGLRIGTLGRGGFTDLATRYTLKVNGIDPDKEATLIPIRGGDRQIIAGKAGEVDALMLSDPWPVLAVEKLDEWRYVINYTTGEGPELFRHFGFSMLQSSKPYIAKNRQIVEKMVRATIRAQNFIGDPKNLDEVVRIALSEFKDYDPAVLRRTMEISAKAFRPQVEASMIEKNTELLRVTDQASGAMPTYEDLVDKSFQPLWKAYRY